MWEAYSSPLAQGRNTVPSPPGAARPEPKPNSTNPHCDVLAILPGGHDRDRQLPRGATHRHHNGHIITR